MIPRADDFTKRHIGSNQKNIQRMLEELGVSSLEELSDKVVPQSIRSKTPFKLPRALDENRLNKLTRTIAAQNKPMISMIGMGYYGTVTPTVIRRNVLENPDWYTAYTPYQPEVSQARLEILLAFQQMVMDLTSMEIANGSLLDEATAAAEAMLMAYRVSKSKSQTIFVDQNCFAQTLAVIQTRARPLNIKVVVGNAEKIEPSAEYFAIVLQYPNVNGDIFNYQEKIKQTHDKGGLVIFAADILSLTMLKPPGELGADIVVGSTQRFGVPIGFGGPHAAYFATHEKYKRSIPGRLIGVSIDANGKRAYRMALQTREQHIRRDKATSNICTSQVLLAVIATVYAMYHGPEGLLRIAERVNRFTRVLASALSKLNFQVVNKSFFDTITVRTPGQALQLIEKARQARYNLRHIDDDHIGISLDETTTQEKIEGLIEVIMSMTTNSIDENIFSEDLSPSIPEGLRRKTSYLEHALFHSYRSETEFMRFLRRTVSKDITLTRSMIPLGSCTMKLNAASEMEAISNPYFAHIHPFAPSNQTKGYKIMLEELESILCSLTGFSGFSFQPNAGSQGEYAGLLCIKAWHVSRGESQRDICLIPSSAHGTNPASAILAGMKVVVISCDDEGNIDLNDVKEKAAKYKDNLASMMVTYPSTHGVFEDSIRELCDIIHEHGGQIYMDGANMNAMVGLTRPAEIGADVMHLNLHKTFAIPHGGGGPGMGPIGVVKHLMPFLPSHPFADCNHSASSPIGTVSAAPWGSALILLISWSYLRLLGTYGLTRSTQVAILNANYIAKRLHPYYPVVYRGKGGFVAHECIISLAEIKESTGVTVEDVAKRLIDYGYHAPTMSWPVVGSLMIEPTESESLTEIDRFCDALISIRTEIETIKSGKVAIDESPLRHAPHSHHLLINEKWERSYSRKEAFFPNSDVHENKYWPPVGRIDNAYGDKNLVCSCPSIDEYAEDEGAK